MNTVSANDHDDLIDRYLNGKLLGDELAAFEIAMMEDPALLEAVQYADALKQGLRSERAALQTGTQITATVLPFRRWVQQPISMAASLLVAVLAVRLVQTTMMPAPSSTVETPVPTAAVTPAVLGIGSVLLLETTRGDNASALQFTGAAPYLFQIDVGLGNEAETFTVTLADSEGKEVLKQQGLKADVDGWVRMVVNQELAGSRSLGLNVSNQSRTVTKNFLINAGK